jgi:hypothetical protein
MLVVAMGYANIIVTFLFLLVGFQYVYVIILFLKIIMTFCNPFVEFMENCVDCFFATPNLLTIAFILGRKTIEKTNCDLDPCRIYFC